MEQQTIEIGLPRLRINTQPFKERSGKRRKGILVNHCERSWILQLSVCNHTAQKVFTRLLLVSPYLEKLKGQSKRRFSSEKISPSDLNPSGFIT